MSVAVFLARVSTLDWTGIGLLGTFLDRLRGADAMPMALRGFLPQGGGELDRCRSVGPLSLDAPRVQTGLVALFCGDGEAWLRAQRPSDSIAKLDQHPNPLALSGKLG